MSQTPDTTNVDWNTPALAARLARSVGLSSSRMRVRSLGEVGSNAGKVSVAHTRRPRRGALNRGRCASRLRPPRGVKLPAVLPVESLIRLSCFGLYVRPQLTNFFCTSDVGPRTLCIYMVQLAVTCWRLHLPTGMHVPQGYIQFVFLLLLYFLAIWFLRSTTQQFKR